MSVLRRFRGNKGADDLLTGVICARTDDWEVTWAGDGALPANLRAPSLSEAASQAATAAANLYAGLSPNPAAELQLALYPWDYRDGPMFDVTGSPGDYTARDLGDSAPAIHGATLEDLVSEAETMPGAGPGHCMLRWIRPISALPDTGAGAGG